MIYTAEKDVAKLFIRCANDQGIMFVLTIKKEITNMFLIQLYQGMTGTSGNIYQ